MFVFGLLILHLLSRCCQGYNWTKINLPEEHMPYFFRNNPTFKAECHLDKECPYKTALSVDRCWGYEKNCPIDQRMSSPTCPETDQKRSRGNEDRFWQQGDFGYIKQKKDELQTFCKPTTQADSLLACSSDTAYCYVKNFYIDMRNNTLERIRKNAMRYETGFWLDGEIGGHCSLDKERLKKEGRDTDPLSTWNAELERFAELPFRPIDHENCDVIFEKPVVFMKLDAGVNMYHHYCDFLNLYISQHINNSFTMDVQIIFWIVNRPRYGDMFKETFDAFTEHQIDFLYNYHSKRICVKEAMFPMLARARHGLFYSTYLIPGCIGSSLFKAFSEHLTFRLKTPSVKPKKNKIRITLLDRASRTRNILNQNELAEALSSVQAYEVNLVAYKFREIPFLDQIKNSHNTDIFIGIHGAGLTHMLFQPDWGAVIELYNCKDIKCYLDLARLRGLKYLTWERDDLVYPDTEDPNINPKFRNYTFDVGEFLRLVAMAADYVQSHPKFIAAREHGAKDEL